MNEKRFNSLLQEMIEENPFAIRAVLRILEVQFTDSIPTLAVTKTSRPRLLVNMSFLEEHCHTEKQVKAVLMHEFLHILLLHTEEKKQLTPARHLALDAVINAIIHRQYGPDYSSMMLSYYAKETGLKKLLRPMNKREQTWLDDGTVPYGDIPGWAYTWGALYKGLMIADDIESLAEEIDRTPTGNSRVRGPFRLKEDGVGDISNLLGDHEEIDATLSDELQDALQGAMKEMNGSGIWRAPKSHGIGANPYEALFTEKNEPMSRWRNKTIRVLKRHLQPDRKKGVSSTVPADYHLPVLSPGDRRAFVKSLWAPFLPEAVWHASKTSFEGRAQIYLDVSGSMDAEMPLLIALFGRLSHYIKRPFWAFSDVVSPAMITNGQLKTDTSGGTSMACVLEHIAATRPSSAVVVTDGYIEQVDTNLLARTAATKIHAIVTRDGSPAALRRIGMPYTQLDEVPS